MATLPDNPSFTANEVILLQQTDLVEGAGVNASYGGIGRSNQQAQQLANRTAFIKGRQDTNIANIASLQTFVALFTGRLGGVYADYVELPYQDLALGRISLVIQWGQISLLGRPASALKNASFSANFQIPFPNQCRGQFATWQSNQSIGLGAFLNCMCTPECITPYSRSQITIFSDYDDGGSSGNGGTINIANSATDGRGLTALVWAAWGY